jgi:hypothetical protein
MSNPLTSTVFPALSTGYTAPSLQSLSSQAKTQAKNAAGNFLSGGSAANGTTATGANGSTAATGATNTTTGTTFHHMLDQALKKSAQGMATHAATAVGVHPDQSNSPTNAQSATGHAVNVIA